MGADNKLLLPIDGEPVVRRTARQILAAGPEEIIVVLGHEADLVCHALDGLAIRAVVNPAWRDGQMTSVHAGLAALSAPVDGIMICLADQPFLEAGGEEPPRHPTDDGLAVDRQQQLVVGAHAPGLAGGQHDRRDSRSGFRQVSPAIAC